MNTTQEAEARNERAAHMLEVMLGNGILDIPAVLATLRGQR